MKTSTVLKKSIKQTNSAWGNLYMNCEIDSPKYEVLGIKWGQKCHVCHVIKMHNLTGEKICLLLGIQHTNWMSYKQKCFLIDYIVVLFCLIQVWTKCHLIDLGIFSFKYTFVCNIVIFSDDCSYLWVSCSITLAIISFSQLQVLTKKHQEHLLKRTQRETQVATSNDFWLRHHRFVMTSVSLNCHLSHQD